MNRTKKEVLLANGWEISVGYLFPTPRADQFYETSFYDADEVESVVKQGPKEYFSEADGEEIYCLDEAWDLFLDRYYDEHDKEFDEEVRV